MQRLGALAARLKTKDELYDALAELAPDALGLKAPSKKKKAAPEPPAIPAEPPRPVAVKKVAAEKKAATEKKAAPEKKVAPVKKAAAGKKKAAEAKPSPGAGPAPSKPRPPTSDLRPPAVTSPQRLPKKNKPAERRVVRDFFVPPGSRALPAAFGDDRVMLFPRDPGGVYVSWDLSPETWGQGGLRLALRDHEGTEVWASEVHAPQGSVSLSGDFGGASLRAVLERGGVGVCASPAVLMPGSERAFAQRWRVRVDPAAQLPVSPEKIGPSYGALEAPAALGEASRLLGVGPDHPGRGVAPSRLG